MARAPDLAKEDDAGSMEQAVRAEQVQVIYQQAKPAMFISVVVSGLVCAVLLDERNARPLAAWFGAIVAVALLRLAFVVRYARLTEAERDFTVWERRFVVTLTLTGFIWGVGAWLVMPGDSLAHQAIVYFFLMGMAGGAVASYSAHAVAVSLATVTVMVPSTLWFALQDSLPLRAMAAGGVIYLAAAYRATRTLAFFLRRSFQLSHELRIAQVAAERLARTDALTGLANRRAFYEIGELVFNQSQRYAERASVVMLDVDRFKSINDTYGHAAGDRALRAVADVLGANVRAADVAGRLGGEEFAILLPHAGAGEAVTLAERLRQRIGEAAIEHEGITIRLTASFGVAELDERSQTLDSLVARADAALYEAKEGGRDRVVSASRPPRSQNDA